jgi:tetratricopeptide (TPR) repeat protein
MNTPKITYIDYIAKPVKKEFYETKWFNSLLKITSVVLNHIPPLKRYIAKTASGMIGRAHQNLKAGNFNEAYQICLDGLKKFGDKTDWQGNYDWWEFMRYGAFAANKLNEIFKKNELLSIANDRNDNFSGFGVADAFCIFSRWKYQQKEYDDAVEFAERALKADDTYAECHALLGWYKLFIEQSDPIEYLKSSILCDNNYLHRIVNDPEMEKFPNIISELRDFKIVKKKG